MAKMTCAICNRPFEEEKMKVLIPTEAEKASMKALGEETPLDSYAYCKGCIGIVSNPTTGLAFMKGLIQHHAKSSGITSEVAEAAANRFAVKLLGGTPKKPDHT